MTADVPVDEQVRLLDSLCAHDAELRAEVASLLASDCDSGKVIVQAVQSEAALLLERESMPDKRVGAYRIVREIGRGGMGAVYLATRDDQAYQKQVAVKVVKPGMDTADVLNRFRYERQILASLDHPYIARLFDGGSTDEGLPFFVMEYIEGQPVNSFCRGKTLSNRARCELFLKILEAVSYAHRNLVVHRDLKPGNIFVTQEGEPKLLDFGVAKLISGNGEGGHTVASVHRPFTPEYASPEQVLGLAVTTSTDIYSLGAVFYEILTDRRAQPILTPTPAEIEYAVCEIEAPRPSQIAPSVDEDLDNIVLMAMRKEPERRYHTVDQFGEDIQRYLDGRPILARQDSVTYRLRKFLVRNRVELTTVSVMILGLSGALGVSLHQTNLAKAALGLASHENARAKAEARRAEDALGAEARQRAIAERQTTIAEEQRDIAQRQTAVANQRLDQMFELAERTLFGVHDSVAKLPGSMAARKEIVATTLEYLQDLETQNGMTDDMRIALAAAYYKVSLFQGNPSGASMQDFAAAEVSLKKGQSIILPLYKRKGNDPGVILRWIEIQSGLADLAYQSGRQREAIEIESALIPVAHRLGQVKECGLVCETQESAIENDVAKKYIGISDPRGLEHAQRGVAEMKELVARHPQDRSVKQALGSSLASAAGAIRDAGELEESANYFRQSIQLREELLHEQPADAAINHNLMVTYGNYAGLLGVRGFANLGRLDEARVYAGKSLAIAREAVKSDAQDVTARLNEGMALSRMGMIDPSPEGVKDSLATLEESYSLIEPIAKTNKQSATQANQLANILDFEGHRLEALNKNADAIQSYRKSLELLQPFMDAGNGAVVGQEISTEEDLARILASTGESSMALEVSSRAVAQAEKRNAAPPANEYYAGALARAYATMALVQAKAGDAAQARQNAEKAMTIWKQIHNRGVLALHSDAEADNERLLAGLDSTK